MDSNESKQTPKSYKISARTATSLVISSMIGTGVFTTLGFQLVSTQNTWSIILLWTLGGLIALIGAFTYAELGTHFKESGGDYIFLSRIFHPVFGYLYAWTSLTVGFSAPIAIAALAMRDYLMASFGLNFFTQWIGIITILILGLVHSKTIKVSGQFQDLSGLVKMVFILGLIIVGFIFSTSSTSALTFDSSWQSEIWKPGFAVSLIYVTYAYQGWNQAAYITEEIKQPKKNLPLALVGGTLMVTIIYVLLQYVFLKHASVSQLLGQAEVATISFKSIVGERGVVWISALIAIQLVATMSSYIWVGSRLTHAMASEQPLWKPLSVRSKAQIPIRAIWLQVLISLALLSFASLEQVMLYAGFVLQLMSTLTIFSSFFIKPKHGAFKSPFGRWLQVIYILLSIVILAYILYERPVESLFGLIIIFVGLGTYIYQEFINKR